MTEDNTIENTEDWTPELACERGILAYHCNAQLTDNFFDPKKDPHLYDKWVSGWYIAKIDDLGPGY